MHMGKQLDMALYITFPGTSTTERCLNAIGDSSECPSPVKPFSVRCILVLTTCSFCVVTAMTLSEKGAV